MDNYTRDQVWHLVCKNTSLSTTSTALISLRAPVRDSIVSPQLVYEQLLDNSYGWTSSVYLPPRRLKP